MIDTKLILIEGIPGSGKSTTSSFIANQLGKNHIEIDWYHENSKMHPTSFIFEACLTESDYKYYINKYPFTEDVINKLAVIRGKNRFIDLIEVERHYKKLFGESAIDEIKKYDVWESSNIDRYIDLAKEKWEFFAKQAKKNNKTIILDSSVFQYQIWTLLLRNTENTKIKSFVLSLIKIIEKLNPVLIYFYQNEQEKTIRKVLEQRGEKAINYLLNRDKDSDYAKSSNQTGLERLVSFVKEYGEIANELSEEVNINKICIENSDSNWSKHYMRILEYLTIPYIEADLSKQVLEKYVGNYCNDEIKTVIDIQLIDDDLVLFGYKKLRYQNENIFNVGDLSVGFEFFTDENGTIKGLKIAGVDICLDWTEIGKTFYKKETCPNVI